MPWYVSVTRVTSGARDLLRQRVRIKSSHRVTALPRHTEQSEFRLKSASTLLDRGGVQVLRSQCAAFRSRRRREAPGCSPVIGGFVLSASGRPWISPGAPLTVRHHPSRTGVFRSDGIACLYRPSAATISQVRCVGSPDIGQTRVSWAPTPARSKDVRPMPHPALRRGGHSRGAMSQGMERVTVGG
jgi:hypothetical protein